VADPIKIEPIGSSRNVFQHYYGMIKIENAEQFGGPWTEKKLASLENYLKAYLDIFHGNPRARKLTIHYVDAFAGPGFRKVCDEQESSPDLLFLDEEHQYMDGSVRRVLSLAKGFDKYWFIDAKKKHTKSLKQMIKSDFPDRASKCEVVTADANKFLVDWTGRLQTMDRAVVFLDPLGMQVQWKTVEDLGKTQKVDLWMLFPYSSVVRMLPNAGPPDEAWSDRLTQLFGDDKWRQVFYPQEKRTELFGPYDTSKRDVTMDKVLRYLLKKLNSCYSGVIEKPLVLYNSKNSPLYLLVFAAGNKKAADTATRIAQDIVDRN